MNEITLPPSPNWYLSKIIACANDGTVAWGARNSIVIAKANDNSKLLDYSIIDKAYTDRVTSIAFSPYDKTNNNYRLVSTGDDNVVKIWNLTDLTKELENSKLESKSPAVAVDWSKKDVNVVCFISGDGVLVKWNIQFDSSHTITFGKLTATCLACCPHDSNLVAVGCKSGLIYIIDIRGTGIIKYKLRGHDVEITSLSWCPVPINIFEKEKKELLLASSATDRSIFLWKAGSDGRAQTQFSLPSQPLDTSKHRSKNSFIAVNWLAPSTILSCSPWGELLLWNLTGNAKKKYTPTLVHNQHSRGIFGIAGIVDESTLKVEEIDNEDWRSKTNIKAIWTVAQDRQVVCCNIEKGETVVDYIIPTQGGFVYCLSACPIDTTLLAVGVGDAMIRLWNLSEPHETKIEMQSLWEKIKGKVRSLSWHPEKENLIAYGTDEGRIGIFDTNSKKPPHLCKQYFRRVVYTLQWGPAPNVEEYALYANGDGEIVYYRPDKLQEDPVPVIKKKDCTEFCWKPDYSMLAIGFNNGSILFYNRDLKKKNLSINALNKAVQCMTWHPESTMSDSNVSPMKNYLAVAVNDTPITIFEVLTTDSSNSGEQQTTELDSYKTIATLNGHSDKVVGLAWSPHISGYLVSCSYDYTAQVWKVETQEIIATFTSHLQPIQCCMWSPLSQDYIITGSADFTLRIWKISNQEAITSIPTPKTYIKNKKQKKKKTKTAVENQAVTVNEVKTDSTNNGVKPVENDNAKSSEGQLVENTDDVTESKTKKKKTKKINLFPGYTEIFNNNKLWCASVRNLLSTAQTNNQDDTSNLEQSTETVTVSDEMKETNKKISTLFGNKKDLEEALNYEKNILRSNEQFNSIVEIDQWTNTNLEESILAVMKINKLNDFCISLAASVSKEFWEQMCEAYASQLVFEDNPQKAASYLLCINKVHEAIRVLLTAKLYRPAYVLAASRLDSTDDTIREILMEWAIHAQQVGNFQNAIECYIKLEEYTVAAKLLERRKDVDSLLLAVDIAKLDNDSELSTSLAEKALMQALINSDINVAKLIIKENPELQYYETEIDVFDELNKTIENVNDDSIINWIKGSSDVAVLDTLSKCIEKCPKKYSLLLQKNLISLPVSRKMILINVSRQLALALLTDLRSQKLQHIVRAFDVIIQHDKTKFEAPEDNPLPLINYLLVLDNKILVDSSNIYKLNENGISVSLRAYLCHAIISWFNKSKFSNEPSSEHVDLVLSILKNCIQDLLNKESVKFWTTANEIRNLESQLSATISKSNDSEVDESKTIIERLDQLRNDKNQFLSNRVSSPNPLFSYGIINEFISKITNEKASLEINELTKDVWNKAIL